MEAVKASTGKGLGVYQANETLEPERNQTGTRSEEDRTQTGNGGGNAGSLENSQQVPSHAGFDDFFHCADTGTGLREEQYQPGTTLQPALTLKEAVEFYKISEKTIRLHITQGKIPARKEQGLKGLEWRIYPSGLPAVPEIVEGITEIEVDDNQPGTMLEPDRNQVEITPVKATSELDKLLDVIRTQAEKLEAANYRIGYLEAQTVSYQEQVKLLTDSQHKPAGWRKFWSWFTGR
ncbi:MAG: hypothetical protein C0469_03410 [Cyanobacteria bacterium DS2.3.42]|nr:hypothetical protein [Cyanobacteria bacterium DS2.3.42]